MDFKTFFVKNIIRGFFITSTCICAAMAVLGMLFEPDTRFGYQGLLYPLIFGAVTMLPALINYSKREISVREALIRKLLQFILIEGIVLCAIYFSGTLTNATLALSLALSVLLIFAAVHFVIWVNDKKTAKAFNDDLQKFQQSMQQYPTAEVGNN